MMTPTGCIQMKIRNLFIVLALLSFPLAAADVQVGIGINLSTYPNLVVVPGYPVYYAPGLDANFFYYDGMYWVYQDDNWYVGSWYNGPWWFVAPEAVPVFILRIPVRYYRRPPVYFRGWRSNAPPHWGEHWGHDWERSRNGWDKWNRSAVPAPAPLPTYQRQYSGERYPRQVEQQQVLQHQHYRYQPHDSVARQHYQGPSIQRAPVQQQRTIPERHDMLRSQPGHPDVQDRGQPRRDAPMQDSGGRQHFQGPSSQGTPVRQERAIPERHDVQRPGHPDVQERGQPHRDAPMPDSSGQNDGHPHQGHGRDQQ